MSDMPAPEPVIPTTPEASTQVPLELVVEKLSERLGATHKVVAILEAANDVLQQQNAHLRGLLASMENHTHD